jgi:hypothetical protein
MAYDGSSQNDLCYGDGEELLQPLTSAATNGQW